MIKYKKHQFFASIWVAIFIVSFSLCLMVMNRSVYSKSLGEMDTIFLENYLEFKSISKQIDDRINRDITTYEMEMDYRYLAEDFSSFFKIKYDSMDYDIKPDNIDKLNSLKAYYRTSWLFAVVSLTGMLYSFNILRKGRYFSSLLYGSLISVFITVINAFRFFMSDKTVISGLRDMVLYKDYSYFIEGDMLLVFIPPDFARNLALAYLFFVVSLIVLMLLIRLIIIYRGRPHKF